MYTHFPGWKSWAEKLFSPYSLNLFCAFAGYGTLSELNQLQLERILLALLAFFPSCYMFRDISSAYELRSRKITKDLFSKGDRSFLPQEFISESPRDIFWNSTKHLIFQHCAFFVQESSFQFKLWEHFTVSLTTYANRNKPLRVNSWVVAIFIEPNLKEQHESYSYVLAVLELQTINYKFTFTNTTYH